MLLPSYFLLLEGDATHYCPHSFCLHFFCSSSLGSPRPVVSYSTESLPTVYYTVSKTRTSCMVFSAYCFHPSGPSNTHGPLPLLTLIRSSDFKIIHKFFLCAFVTQLDSSGSSALQWLDLEMYTGFPIWLENWNRRRAPQNENESSSNLGHIFGAYWLL